MSYGYSTKSNAKHSKSCLVLDLDETLVHFFGSDEDWDYVEEYEAKSVRNRILDINVEGEFMWGIERPYTRRFLARAQELFDCVGIWSAGVESYVTEIAKKLFPVNKPYFVWARDKCVVTILDGESVRQKPLSKLFQAYPEFDPKRTIIMDDRSEVCLQDTLSHIDMPIWDATLSDLERSDNALECISEWMEYVVPNSKNFRTAIHKGIFCSAKPKVKPTKKKKHKSQFKVGNIDQNIGHFNEEFW